MFGRVNLIDQSTYFNRSIIFYFILLIWLSFSQVCNASLSLYNTNNWLIKLYSTVDFMWVNNLSSGPFNGTITVASFSSNKSLSPCTLNSVPVNTTILLVPFNEGLTNYGCSSYADIIESNIWLQKMSQPTNTVPSYYSTVTHDTITSLTKSSTNVPITSPTMTTYNSAITNVPDKNTDNNNNTVISTATKLNIPNQTDSPSSWQNFKMNRRMIKKHIKSRNVMKSFSLDSPPRIEVVIFTSMNNGDPGIGEKYAGNLQMLSKAAPTLTLMRIVDMSNTLDFLNQTSYAIVTRDSGPWIDLLNGKAFLAWTIVSGILYGCIFIIALGLILWGVYKNTFALHNPKPWLLGGIVVCATIFPVIYTYDPWGIRYHRMSDFEYQSFVTLGYFFLCINYIVFLYPWAKATRNLADDLDYGDWPVRRIKDAFIIVILLAVFIKIISFILYILSYSPTITTSTLGHAFNIVNIVLETIIIILVICGYSIFGTIMILARKNDTFSTVDPTAPRDGLARRIRRNEEIIKTALLTISLILSFLFITIHTMITASLTATIRNFWITRITDDLSFVIGCIVLLIALHSDSIAKYSHMIYASSPEDSSAETSQSNSRDASFHNTGETSTQNGRRRRDTLEILFGRKSIVGL